MFELTTEEKLFKAGIFELATNLCMQANGSGDPWTKQREEEVVDYLERRLCGWTDRRRQQANRDAYAKAYVSAALEEWRRCVDYDSYFVQG